MNTGCFARSKRELFTAIHCEKRPLIAIVYKFLLVTLENFSIAQVFNGTLASKF